MLAAVLSIAAIGILFGLVVAFVGVLLVQLTGNPIFDGLASVVIGVILAAVAVEYIVVGLLEVFPGLAG